MEDLREKCSKERENSLQRPKDEKKLIVFKEQPVWLENKKEPCKMKSEVVKPFRVLRVMMGVCILF